MTRCKNCGTFYASSLPVCPKCGIDPEKIEEETSREAKPGETKKNWLLILIGVPLLIILLYLLCGGILRMSRM